MAILRCHKLGSLLVAVAVAGASLLIVTTAAEAAKVGLFRMKRTWWGGTTANESPDPYISQDWQPRLKGPQKQPAPSVYVGSTTVSGRPAPRFTAPSKFIKDYTWHSACVPGTCSIGYPASSAWYSYWNLPGKWQPNNSRFGGASKTTTVIFPTTGGNTIKPPLNQGNPATSTTTPCVGGGLTSGGKPHCGTWAMDFLAHKVGDPIRFDAGNYDFDRAGSIMITPGKNRFGGTMHFFYGPNHLYYQLITLNTAYLSRAYGPQMDVRKSYTDGSAMAFVHTQLGDVQYGGPFDIYRFTVSGTNLVTTGNGNIYKIRAPYFYTLAPFTTGMVTVDQPGPGFHTEFQLTGYDNRTPNGISGVISMVRPRLVQTYKVYPNPSEPVQHTWASGSAWEMDFHFLPEPGSSAMLASGLVLLAGLYRLRRR